MVAPLLLPADKSDGDGEGVGQPDWTGGSAAITAHVELVEEHLAGVGIVRLGPLVDPYSELAIIHPGLAGAAIVVPKVIVARSGGCDNDTVLL